MVFHSVIRRRVTLILAGLAAGVLGAAYWLLRPPAPTPPDDLSAPAIAFPIPAYTDSPYLNTAADARYIGSAACAVCHPANHQSYLRTAHSKALSDVDPLAEPADGSFRHEPSGRSYRVYRKDGQLRHEEVLRNDRGEEVVRVDLPVRYLVGSGHFCRTYVVEVDGFLHESPITYYTSKQKWDLSPGYDFPLHWGFERPIRIGCVSCHAGRVEETDGAVNKLTFLEKAIGCENCHGPGSLHEARHRGAEKPAAGEDDLTIVHPAKLSRPLLESVCASCHQGGPAGVAIRGRKPGDFRPGRPLSDFRVHYQFAGGGDRMTVVGHVEQLRQSACYQKSDRLTCVTCHDPHRSEAIPSQKSEVGGQKSEDRGRKSEVRSPAPYYLEKCLSCHTLQSCTGDKAERQKRDGDNCVACHMPRGDTEIPHLAFTHHRIGRHGGKPEVGPEAAPELVALDEGPSLGPLDRKRNLGLAYFELVRNPVYARFESLYRERAREHLEAVDSAGLHEGTTSAVLAEIYWKRNDRPRAADFARKALDAPDTPSQSRAQSLLVLADCERQDHNYEAAIPLLEEVVRLSRTADNWRLLGVSYLDLNRYREALPPLQTALAIRPYRHVTHQTLAEAYRRLGDDRRSREHLDIAKWLHEHHQD